ncbi:MAG: DUF4097 domain-containing protein [Candidatus Moduliflexus flocculans]|nr:DUF4097 domain-containing protein [Candidatus Moduliflexus flocculans]
MRRPALLLSPLVAVLALSAACHPLPRSGRRRGLAPDPGARRDDDAGARERSPPRGRRAGPNSGRRSTCARAARCPWRTISATSRSPAGTATRSTSPPRPPARDRGRRPARPRLRRYLPDVEVRETGGGLMVRTRTFEGTGTPPAVDYRVRVPDSVVLTGIRLSEGDLTVSDVFGKLEASVDQGDLVVENFSGAVDVTVGTGDADVEVLDLREEDTITITCRRGNIVLRLESGVGAIVEADAPRGRVRSDFDLGVELPAATVKGWIGEGGPNIILRAPNGRIEIVKIKATGRDAVRGARAVGEGHGRPPDRG